MNPARTELERARNRCLYRELDWRETRKLDDILRRIREAEPLAFEKWRGEVMLRRLVKELE